MQPCVDTAVWDTLKGAVSAFADIVSDIIGSRVGEAILETAGNLTESYFKKSWASDRRFDWRHSDGRFGLSELQLSAQHLTDAVWRARLVAQAYTRDESQLRAKLSVMGCRLRKFVRQEVTSGGVPQWFSCTRSSGELVVAFRGTMSIADAATDSRTKPLRAAEGVHIHEGFLMAVRQAWRSGLSLELSSDAVQAVPSVLFVGHSLGGALAVSLLAANLLPRASPGKYSVSTFGAPAVIYKVEPLANQLRHAKVEQWILEDDPVPRILGSSYTFLQPVLSSISLATSLMEATTSVSQYEWWSLMSNIVQLGNSASENSHGYIHPKLMKVYWLRSRRILEIPAAQRSRVLTYRSIHDLPTQSILHHSFSAYAGALQHLVERRNEL